MLIPLSSGLQAIVDDEDGELLSGMRWHSKPSSNPASGHYAYASRPLLVPRTLFMHRLIMGVTDPAIQTHHVNGDTLDNRRSNLRLCTPSQNSAARRNIARSATGYRGVYAERGVFSAQISISGRAKRVGYFKTAEEAAAAFDEAAIRQYGDFAVLNFPQIAVEHGDKR